MKITKYLKERNRTILEMYIGDIVYGLTAWGIGAIFVKNQVIYASSLWFGVALSMLATLHMYRTIDRALDFDEENAAKIMHQGYVIRYLALCLVMIGLCFLKALNPLVAFLGYMSLKGTVYLQPFTHKLCNTVFHETDPIPEPIVEEPPMESQDEISDHPMEQ